MRDNGEDGSGSGTNCLATCLIPLEYSVIDDQLRDVTIIGAGPTGLFGAFYAGMRQMSTRIIDGLGELGGQLTALYPEKYIYDMPGFPRIKARDLVLQQAEQGLQYGAEVLLGQKVLELVRRSDGIWELHTECGKVHPTRTVVISAGAGSFSPRRLPLEEAARFEGRGIQYFVREMERLAGRDILIVGGGDSAVDWALHLEPIARSVTLIHRRDRFRAHEESIEQMMRSSVDIQLFWEVDAIYGDEHVEAVMLLNNKTGERRRIEVNEIILALGFHADIGPIRSWGLDLEKGSILVNSRMETNLPGVYAAGDVATYDGKLKLIATGVGEAAMAVNHAKVFIDPGARAFPGHSSDTGAPLAAEQPAEAPVIRSVSA